VEYGFVDNELIWNGAAKAAICSTTESAITWASAGPMPVICDQRLFRRIGAVACTGRKRAAGVSSSTTPVKCLESSARGSLRTPIAGSWITAPLALMELRTTKWLTSQCRIAGIRTFERAESATRSGRVENPSWSASPNRLRSEMPDIDKEKRWRRPLRSTS
jgi:hypothetical protein